MEMESEIRRIGYQISSAFVVWQGEGEDRKGLFVIKIETIQAMGQGRTENGKYGQVFYGLTKGG